MRRRLLASLATALCFLAARAHDSGAARVRIAFAPDGRVVVVARLDPEHLMPGPLRASREAFRKAFIDGARIAFDGQDVPLTVLPSPTAPAGPFEVHFEARVPPGATAVSWSQSAPIGWYLAETMGEADAEPVRQWLDVGQPSKPFVLARAAPAPSLAATLVQYLKLGYEHILPRGLDHILFVLGLFLLSVRWKPLLLQVTAFTVAHSITLGLAMFGVVSLPSSIVEPAIALSIVYVAIENVFAHELHRGRVVLVFCFGLLHGLGFAGVLRDLGLPRSQFVPALLAFNVGVEAGQLSVLALAFVAFGAWLGKREWYRARVVVPASLAIAAVGLYWTVQRLAGAL